MKFAILNQNPLHYHLLHVGIISVVGTIFGTVSTLSKIQFFYFCERLSVLLFVFLKIFRYWNYSIYCANPFAYF
jgi:hypothetical protein